MKKPIDNSKIFNSISIDKGNNAVSHTEATGLIPALPENEYEINSYREINEYQQIPISNKQTKRNR